MELLKEEKGKKFFLEDENKVYCMLDMGAYVGNRFRAWYEEAPEVWRLMFLDEKRQNDLLSSISGIQTLITCTGLDDFVKNRFEIDRLFHVTQGSIEDSKLA